ncbi:MAG: imidazole glycerol phosphate synthase subunit HisH [archaeon]|nr:imidazole glycerol phosphate synthase subunit HisH [archaeon]
MKMLMADYNVGNLHSIKKALELAGAEIEVVTDMSRMVDAKCMVFPGVGAFDCTIESLLPYKEAIRARLEAGVPCLGVCIGTHILFPGSDEGNSPGISFFDGRVRGLRSRTVPHMGWNSVETEDPLLDDIEDKHFYFAHSYFCDPETRDTVKGTTTYEGFQFATLMRRQNVVATQFHPEKSSESGLRFLKNFVTFAEDQA